MLIPTKQIPVKTFALRNRNAFLPVPLIVLTILLAGLVSQGAAQTYDWSNIGASGSADPYFNTGANWNGGIAPGATDTARFNANRLYQVWWNPAASSQLPEVGVLTVTSGQVGFANQDTRTQSLLTINGVGNASDFNVSGAGTELTILGHHVRSLGGGQVLDGAELTVDGSHATGSQLSIDGTTFDIAGRLSVESGGIVSSSTAAIGRWSGDTGDVTLTDQSEWNSGGSLLVGAAGNGKLFIESGSRLTSASAQIGGASTSNQSLVSVSGGDSSWDSGNLVIGLNGDASMSIDGGGQVTSIQSDIGVRNGSNSSVSVMGGSWTSAAGLFVGLSGQGSVNIQDGTVSAGNVRLGVNDSGIGHIIVDGNSSLLTSNSTMNAGSTGDGWLEIKNGGMATGASGTIGEFSSSTAHSNGTVTVTDSGSSWILTRVSNWSPENGHLTVGAQGDGQLTVSDGGFVSNFKGAIATSSSSNGTAIVTGMNSEWQNEDDLEIAGSSILGAGGTGRLEVLDQGKVTVNGATTLWGGGTALINGGELVTSSFDNSRGGQLSLVDGSLKVNGVGGAFDPGTPSFTINGGTKDFAPTLTIDNQATASLPDGLTIGDNNDGHLIVSNGGHVDNGPGFVAKQASSVGSATVTGAGSQWDNVKLYVGGSSSSGGGLGSVSITDEGHVEVAAKTKIWSTGTVTIDGGSLKTHTFDNSAMGALNLIDGKLTVDGGSFDPGISDFKINGPNASAEPILELTNGATANLTGLFQVAESSNGTLMMSGGSTLATEIAVVGTTDTAFGHASISGTGTHWDAGFQLRVGDSGSGELNILDGAVVSGDFGQIGLRSTDGQFGKIKIDGSGSELNLSNALSVGSEGQGRLEVRGGGVVTSNGGGIGLGSDTGNGTVVLSDAGSRWNNAGALLVGGSGSGELRVEAGAKITSLSSQISMATFSPYGTGLVRVTGADSTWTNQTDLFVGGNDIESKGVGSLEIFDNGNVTSKGNATIWETGVVTIDGGQFDVSETLTNAGRIFVTDMGADIFGNVNFVDNGKIETLNGSTAVFHGNVTHNGSQIKTSAASTTQFDGAVTGAGRYLGDGLVKFEDEFRPGNSPAEIEFGGDVEFGRNSLTHFELGGLNQGEFDSLDIAGDLSLDGELSVSLWDEFQLESGQHFLIADVEGRLTGQFEGLGEGDLVGDFGGVNLFISYRAGNGNDVSLFSSVPEPGMVSIGLFVGLGIAMKRRRRVLQK